MADKESMLLCIAILKLCNDSERKEQDNSNVTSSELKLIFQPLGMLETNFQK